MFKPVCSGDGDYPIGMEQPVAEEDNESFLPDQEIIAVLCDHVRGKKKKRNTG